MEAFKEMDDENLEHLLETINEWWRNEEIPEEILQARIAMIFKKGDTSDLNNYRPIALLNSTYKIITAIIQKRLSEVIDPYLQTTQYGFRKNKSTAQAIHIIRRIMNNGHGNKIQHRNQHGTLRLGKSF